MPPKDPTVDYSRQTTQLMLANKVIHQQVRKLLSERQSIYQRVSKLRMQKREEEHKARKESFANMVVQQPPMSQQQQQSSNLSGSGLQGPPAAAAGGAYQASHFSRHKKRYRRTANEIERRFRCPVENCMKAYGCEGSLNQHIKIKHPEIYATHAKMQGGEEFDSKGGEDEGDESEEEFSAQQPAQ